MPASLPRRSNTPSASHKLRPMTATLPASSRRFRAGSNGRVGDEAQRLSGTCAGPLFAGWRAGKLAAPTSAMTFLRIVIPLQVFVLRVISSENRFPLFGITRSGGTHDHNDLWHRTVVPGRRDGIERRGRALLVRFLRRLDLQLQLLQLGTVLRDRIRQRRMVPAQFFPRLHRWPAWRAEG